MGLEEKEWKRVPESTPCISPKGGLGDRKEAEKIYAQDLGPGILLLLENKELILLHKVLKEVGSGVLAMLGPEVIMSGAKAICLRKVGRESEKKTQSIWGLCLYYGASRFLKRTFIEWLLCTGHFIRVNPF